MKPGLRELINLFLAASLLLLVGCGEDQTTPEIPAELLQTETPRAGVDISSTDRFPETGVIYQWADGAETSSEFSDPEWSAEQAVGEPDSPGCGDFQFAWASAASDGIETLTVQFPVLVYPLEIVIHESFNPDQVVKVEVQDPERDGFYTVLQKNPTQIDRPCPYELVVPVEGIDFLTNMVRITVDQSQLGLGWNEIDAVQLIGTTPEE
jgi:hypothetical protein